MNNSVLDVMFGTPTIGLMEDGETLGVTHSTYKNLLEAAKAVEQEYADLRSKVQTRP